ncbi:flagellar basal body protein [Aliirhizobium smilacinae]|uniref:Flagellar basal body rod protein n=1 Tax=Aliirhizobium smilacinae TaxID=1395944 RepID=A0A5C4XF91_9HYPH|nr:flagellar basal body protein [Rhizobium smilacinae]TNM62146.1 flagellar basal body rod protein [Rhizobium smilacinae]
MTISAAMGISVAGMQTQSQRLNTAAHNIANSTTPGYESDTAQEMIDVLTAEQGFAANAAVFETGADMWDMLMTIKRD